MRDELDALIDDTARAMTVATVPHSIAAGVRARLVGGRHAWSALWMPAATTVLMLMIVAASLWRPRPTEEVAMLPPTSRGRHDLVLRTPPAGIGGPDMPSRANRIAHAAAARPPRRPPRVVAVEPLEVMPLVIEPLVEPRLITIDASTSVMPIDIELLRIDPIDTQ